jgi:phage gpG-like protein
MISGSADFASKKLMTWIRNVEAATRPNGKVVNSYRKDVANIVVNGIHRNLLEGKDKNGKPVAPLAFMTLLTRRGNGPPRVPRNKQSRLYRGIEFEWKSTNTNRSVLAFRNIVPFAKYHETGTRRRGGGVLMPARPMMGIDRRTSIELRERTWRLGKDILSGYNW